MEHVNVRTATPDDVPVIIRIGERGWNAAYGDVLSQETIDAAMAEWYDDDSIREAIDRENWAYLVADAAEVVGFVSGGPRKGDLRRDERVAVIGAIYVDPERWGSGIGTALLERFESFCRHQECDQLQFLVLTENEVGVSFYRKHGYEVVDECTSELFGETVDEYVFQGSIT